MPSKTQDEFGLFADALDRHLDVPKTEPLISGAMRTFDGLSKLNSASIEKAVLAELTKDPTAQQKAPPKSVRRYLLDLHVYTWLQDTPQLSNRIVFNQMKQEVQYYNRDDGEDPRDWQAEDDYDILLGVQRDGINASDKHIRLAVNRMAQFNKFDPVMEWLESLQWDGTLRLDNLIPQYFNCDDTRYTRAIGRMFLISAVARQYEPGCQVDHMLILEGRQGLYKTRGLEALFGKDYLNDNLETVTGINASLGLRGYMAVNFDELGALPPKEMGNVKKFITQESQKYIKKFENRGTTEHRRCVFVGTTNDSEYLFDDENRRYWPTEVRGKIDKSIIEADRDQIWAEAVQAYKAGEQWWPADDVVPLIEFEQTKRQPDDPVMDRLHEFVWLHEKITINDICEHVYGSRSAANRGKAANLGKKLSKLGFKKTRHPGSLQYWHRPNPIPLPMHLLIASFIDKMRQRELEERMKFTQQFSAPRDPTLSDEDLHEIYHKCKDQVRIQSSSYMAAKAYVERETSKSKDAHKIRSLRHDALDNFYFRLQANLVLENMSSNTGINPDGSLFLTNSGLEISSGLADLP